MIVLISILVSKNFLMLWRQGIIVAVVGPMKLQVEIDSKICVSASTTRCSSHHDGVFISVHEFVTRDVHCTTLEFPFTRTTLPGASEVCGDTRGCVTFMFCAPRVHDEEIWNTASLPTSQVEPMGGLGWRFMNRCSRAAYLCFVGWRTQQPQHVFSEGVSKWDAEGPGDSKSPSEVGSVEPVWSPGLEVRSLEIALRSDAQAAECRAKEQDLEDGMEQSKKPLAPTRGLFLQDPVGCRARVGARSVGGACTVCASLLQR